MKQFKYDVLISEESFNDEVKAKYISEKYYNEEMKNKVEPYLKKYINAGTLLGKNDLQLHYEKFVLDNPRGNIVISHGFGECAEKYYELVYYFLKENYSVFIIEHRGNARSNRLGIDDSQINVEKFDYYIEDFKMFMDNVVIPNGNKKYNLLFAHSMGGAIGTAFIEKYTSYFDGAVLSSPMHEISTGKNSKYFAFFISVFMKIVGLGKRYLPSQTPYSGERKFPNRTTSSENRYDYHYNRIQKNYYYQTGGGAFNWYLQSVLATKRMLRKNNVSRINIPILLFQAEYDTHVMPSAHYKFRERAKNCTIVYVKGGKHETYFESDKISFQVVNHIISFYNKITQ